MNNLELEKAKTQQLNVVLAYLLWWFVGIFGMHRLYTKQKKWWIYIVLGLIGLITTVISHEVAHALARHGAERMSSAKVQQGIQILGNIVLATTAPEYTNTFNQAYGIGSNLGVMLPYGRLQESEADEIGIYLMVKAGYNPNEAVNFWKNMNTGKKSTNEFFSTHPSSSTRIKDIENVIIKTEKK